MLDGKELERYARHIVLRDGAALRRLAN